MKICWDDLEGIYLSKRGNFRRNGMSFIFMESCEGCGEPYLAEMSRPGKFCSTSCSMKDRHPSNKTRKKLAKYRGPLASAWSGGCSETMHQRAREKFYAGKCEICGMTEAEHITKTKNSSKLLMHCRDKNYHNLSHHNWITVCRFGCHFKVEWLDNSKKYLKGRIPWNKNRRFKNVVI